MRTTGSSTVTIMTRAVPGSSPTCRSSSGEEDSHFARRDSCTVMTDAVMTDDSHEPPFPRPGHAASFWIRVPILVLLSATDRGGRACVPAATPHVHQAAIRIQDVDEPRKSTRGHLVRLVATLSPSSGPRGVKNYLRASNYRYPEARSSGTHPPPTGLERCRWG